MSFEQARARLASKLDWKAGLENIRRLLEITEVERDHELLLTVKNLRELGSSPFPYIIPTVPRSLPTEVIEGEHFVLVDLLKLVPGKLLSGDFYSRWPNGGRYKDLSEVNPCYLASKSTACPLTLVRAG